MAPYIPFLRVFCLLGFAAVAASMVPHDRPTTTLVLGDLQAPPGTKVQGKISVDVGPDHDPLDLPFTLINGVRPGRKIVITAGVHGGEFVGIDAAKILANKLQASDVTNGQVIICPVVNPPAVYNGRLATSSLDGVNLNRVFPGDANGKPTERLADWLFSNVIASADAFLDLHSGGIDEKLVNYVAYRIAPNENQNTYTRRLAQAIGYKTIVFSESLNGGNSHVAATRSGVSALLIESGQRGDRDPVLVQNLVDGLCRLLTFTGVLGYERLPFGLSDPPELFKWQSFVESPAKGLWYPTRSAGDDVEMGQVIGYIDDSIDFSRHPVIAPASGRIIYGMNGLTVSKGSDLAAIAKRVPSSSIDA